MSPANRIPIKLYPLLSSLAAATDLVSPILTAHHRMVAFIAITIGQALGLPDPDLQQLALAGSVHDIGGLSLRRRLDSFEFEVAEPQRHTIPGCVLLASFASFTELARLVRFHHHPWQNGRGEEHNGKAVPQLAHILHLADRIAVQIDFHQEVLNQKNEIIETIARGTGEKFIPEHVEALRFVAEKEAFWFDLTSPEIDGIIQDRLPLGELTLNCDQLPELAQLFRKIIDFRSRFTATHSSGVAAVGVLLAKKSGWDGDGCCEEMELAGLLHDVGKLVVPSEILNKHTPLIDEDFAIIRKHPYYSAWVLRNLGGFGEVSRWVALHHERLDGSGYPYRQSEEKLPEGAKILAVADTFTALMEDRPYRCGMSALGTGKVMRNMAVHRKLDQHYVTLIHDCREEFDEVRFQAQQAADSEHQSFMAECCLLDADLLPEDYCPAGSGAD